MEKDDRCINIKNPRIQKLSRLTGMHPIIVGAKAKIWQNKVSQDKDALPTLRELVSNTYDLKTRTAIALYKEKPEFKALGDGAMFEDYIRLIEGEPTIEGFKDFLKGDYWKIKDAENTAIRNRIYDLQQGVNLTEKELQDSRKALSFVVDKEASKEIKPEYRRDNFEGNISTIVIEASENRDQIKTPKQAVAIANKITKRVNQKFRHPLNKTKGVAETIPTPTGAIVKVTYGMSDIVLRANFDTKDVLITPRLKNKLFEKKALMTLYSEGKISTTTYLEQTNQRGLNNTDLMLTDEEVAVLRDLEPMLVPEVLIDGKLYENVEDANQARKEKYKVFDEEQEFDIMDGDLSINIPKDPVNIEAFKKKREQQIKTIKKKIQDLDNMARATGNYALASARKSQLNQIKEKFEDDLNNGEIINDPLKVVKESFERDIEIIEEIQKDTNLDNIFIARDLIETLKNNLEKQSNKKGYVFSESATIVNIQDVVDGIAKKLSELSSKQYEITLKYFTDIVDKRFDDTLQDLYPGKSKKDVIDSLIAQITDDDILSYQGRSLGRSFTERDPIGEIIRHEYEFEAREEFAKIASLMKTLTNLDETISEDLKKENYQTWFQAFTRQTDKGDVELISKFSQKYKAFIAENLYREKERASQALKNRDWEARNLAYKNMYENLIKGVNFVEIHKLSEIANYLKDTELASEMQVDKTYSKKLKEELGEVEYNDLVQKQINFIEDFINKKNQIIKAKLEELEVSNIDELSFDNKARLEQLVNTYNPFFFSKASNNEVPVTIEKGTFKSPHKLEYNTFYPKRKNSKGEDTGFYDSKFSVIENSPNLLEAWKILENATFIINSNFATSSLNLNKRSVLYYKKSVLDLALDSAPKNVWKNRGKTHLKNTFAWLRNPFSSNQIDTENDNIKLPQGVRSFKNEISQAWQQDLDIIANIVNHIGKARSLEFKVIDFTKLSLEKQALFLEAFGIERKTLEKDFSDLSKINISDLKAYTQQRIYDNHKVDMVKLYKMMLEQSSLHKAKEKAYKTTTEIIDPLTEDVSYYENARSQQTKKETFKKFVLQNDRAAKRKVVNFSDMLKKYSKDGKIDLRVKDWSIETKNLDAEQQRVVKIIRERLDLLRSVKDKLDQEGDFGDALEKQKVDIEEEIERLETRLEGIGRDFTLKDIFEAFAIKLLIKTKLGLNVWAFFQNLFQGTQQALIQAGFKKTNGELIGDYTKQQYTDSHNFLHGVDISKAETLEVQKAHALISQLNIIQDGSDFEQRAERIGISQKPEWRPWKKGAWRLMILTEIGEYMNQAPLILASFSNYNMPDGNPIFNGKTFPYHEIQNGALVLKEKYLTAFKGYTKEQMIADYQDFSSNKASRFAVNVKMNVIGRRNGDYTESGIIEAKKTSIGKSIFTFANWLGEIAGAAYDVERPNLLTGKVEGGYITKTLSSTESRKRSAPLVGQYITTGIGMGAVGATATSLFAGLAATLPGMILPLVLGFMTIKIAMRNKTKDESNGTEIGQLSLDNLKLLGYNMTVGSLMPAINGAVSIFNRISSSNFDFEKEYGLDYTFGGQLTEEEALALYKSSNQTNLMQFIGMLYSMLMYGLFVAIGGDEEDELKNVKLDLDGDGKYETYKNNYFDFQDRKRLEIGDFKRLKFITHNFLKQGYNDTGLTTNAGAMFYTLIGKEETSKAFSPIAEYTSLLVGLFAEDNLESQVDSPYFGQDKGWRAVRKSFTPKPFHNIGEIERGDWYLGLENMSYKYYNTNNLLEFIMNTDLKKDQSKVDSKRNVLRTKIRANIEDYIPKEKVEMLEEIYGTKEYNDLPVEIQEAVEREIVTPILDIQHPSPKKYARDKYDENQKRIKE